MILTNEEIYNILEKISQAFSNNENIYFPAKLNYIVQKNYQILKNIVDDVEKIRIQTAEKYGTKDLENNRYIIPKENLKTAEKEIDDLLKIEQEVFIKKIKYSMLDDIELTMAQMSAIMFMIEEDE